MKQIWQLCKSVILYLVHKIVQNFSILCALRCLMRQNSFFWLNSKFAFLKSAQNEAEIGLFFNGVVGKSAIYKFLHSHRTESNPRIIKGDLFLSINFSYIPKNFFFAFRPFSVFRLSLFVNMMIMQHNMCGSFYQLIDLFFFFRMKKYVCLIKTAKNENAYISMFKENVKANLRWSPLFFAWNCFQYVCFEFIVIAAVDHLKRT